MAKEYYGVDVSFWKGYPDWKKAKLDFAILGVTQRFGVDSSFEYNYKSCKEAGIKIGAYKFSYAMNKTESKREAKELLKVLNGRKLDFPIFLDLEWEDQRKLSKDTIIGIIKGFRKKVIEAGYMFGIYCNLDWYENIIPASIRDKYPLWIASVPSNDTGELVESLRPSIGVGWQYSWNGKISGSDKFDLDVFYTDFSDDNEEAILEPIVSESDDSFPTEEEAGVTADDVIKEASKWIGTSYTGHNQIVDIYNSYPPLPVGYKVQYTDDWCDTFVSAVFLSLGAIDLIGGAECGVERHIQLFKKKGIWEEDGTIIPNPGDLICYNWGLNLQPNDGWGDHIGIVVEVKEGTIVTIEGNVDCAVKQCHVLVGSGVIRGFARPNYSKKKRTTSGLTLTQIADEVIKGKWGNGEERKKALEKAGWNYEDVQEKVNEILRG